MSTQDHISNFIRYRKDPWAFLTECIFTRDAVDEQNPIKPFPSDYEYLRLFCLLWQREKKIAVPKSRRMTMSWTCLAMVLWECIFHKGKEWACVSKKEDDSAELVSRIQFMYNRIPPERIPREMLPVIQGSKMTKSPPKLIFDFGDGLTSYVQGFPMGADQLRQFTFSGIFGDECAFWEVAEEFYTGAKPTTDGGGRMILVSSRAPGFFKKIVFDKINAKDYNFPEVAPSPVKRPIEGIELWKNPKNEFLVVDVHYTANPYKRDPEFKRQLKETLPLHQYMREYERSWQTFVGMPVYPNFRADIHCPQNKPQAHLGLPLLCGVDFGRTPALVIAQLQGNSLKILKEFTAQNESIQIFMPKVMKAIGQLWPEWRDPDKIHFYVDPAGFNKNPNDERTCVQEMLETPGIKHVYPGAKGNNEWEGRRSSVEHYLLHVERESAGIEINESECPTLVTGFKGGYRYPDSANEIEPNKLRPIKNIYSHVHDALQYVAYGSLQFSQEIPFTSIPGPTYSFMKTSTRRPPNGYRTKS